jgi:hypothetical protein
MCRSISTPVIEAFLASSDSEAAARATKAMLEKVCFSLLNLYLS